MPCNFLVDYIGTIAECDFVTGSEERTKEYVEGQVPPLDEEFFEWIDLLEAVCDARDGFTMLEFGAGFGRWAVRGWRAAQLAGITSVKVGLAEAEPRHLEYLRRHLENNGVPAECVDVYEGVVSEDPGEAYFCVYSMTGEKYTPENWYGQYKSPSTIEPIGIAAAAYFGRDLYALPTGHAAIKVQQLQASKIIERYPRIDLIDLDVQGEEFAVIYGAMERLNKRVKRLHIGTHAWSIESDLRQLLTANGWECLRDYACAGTSATPYGEVHFIDGVQSWRNPRL